MNASDEYSALDESGSGTGLDVGRLRIAVEVNLYGLRDCKAAIAAVGGRAVTARCLTYSGHPGART